MLVQSSIIQTTFHHYTFHHYTFITAAYRFQSISRRQRLVFFPPPFIQSDMICELPL